MSTRRLSFGIAAAIMLALLLAAGGFLRRGGPELPPIPTRGLDPAIAEVLERALAGVKAAPRSGEAWGRLGSVLMHYEMPEATRFAFRQAERYAPQEARWPHLHGLFLMNLAPDEAILALRRAAERTGQGPDISRLRLAEFLAERGQVEEAERHFQSLLQRTAGHPGASLGLARLRLAQGQPEEGTKLLVGCLESPHTRRAALALKAMFEQMLGDAEAAARSARQMQTLPSDLPWPDAFWTEAQPYRVGRKAWVQEANALLDQGLAAEAQRRLQELTRRYPEADEPWYLLGWALNLQARPTEAEQALREHLARSASSAKGQAQLAVALLAQKRWMEAIAVLEAAAQLKPTWRELQTNLGYAWWQLGRVEEAAAHYLVALGLDPAYLPSYLALAELRLRQGEESEARQLLQRARLVAPDDPRIQPLLDRARPK